VLVPADRKDRYPALAEDLQVIEEIVTPAFAEYDLDAQREQTRYWLQQVFLIVVAALTTAFGTVQAAWTHQVWPGIVVGLLGSLSAVAAASAQERGAQQAYLDNRTKAERLRAAAFAYLAELPPFDSADRRSRLAQTVGSVARGEEPA